MREDFHNLIKERALVGADCAKIKPVRVTADSEDLPTRAPMTPRVRGWNLKERHDRWGLLDRWLRSRVGRLWNDVHSEICAVNDPRVKTMWDVRDQLQWDIHLNVVLIDGVPHDSKGDRLFWRDFWVHPETGVLMAVPRPEKRRWKGWRKDFNQVPLSDDQRYVQIEGIWYVVTFAEFNKDEYDAFVALCRKNFRPVIYDVVYRRDLSWGYDRARETLVREWGACVYAKHKRQLNSREVKKVAAQWAALEEARNAA
jgi:hypothetical protein